MQILEPSIGAPLLSRVLRTERPFPSSPWQLKQDYLHEHDLDGRNRFDCAFPVAMAQDSRSSHESRVW